MKRKIGLFLVGGALAASLIGGCGSANQQSNKVSNVQSGPDSAYAAVPPADAKPKISELDLPTRPIPTHAPIPTRAPSLEQPKFAPNIAPKIPLAPAIVAPQGALFHDDFADTSLTNYSQSYVSVGSGKPFKWIADNHRLILKGDIAGAADPSLQEVFLTNSKTFVNYTYSANIFRGDTIASGLVFGATDAEHFYCLSFGPADSAGTSHAFLWRKDGNGNPSVHLADTTVPNMPTNNWQEVSVSFNNGTISAKVNGTNILTSHDPSAAATLKGGVGVFASASDALAFANLNVLPAQ